MTADLSKWLDRVTCGDCLDVLRELPDCSVDLCATDPPFGIAFMARGWDQEIPARAIWAEVLRVLKPGASCFVCAGSRQDTILGLLTDLREVGFDIQHAALSWCYATGFPKSTNVGKDIDKAAFLKWVKAQPLTMLPECPFEHKHKGFAARKVECPECKRRVWALRAGYSDEVTRADVRKAASAAVNGEAPDDRPIGADATYNGGNGAWRSNYSHGTLLLAALQARFGDAPGVRARAADYMAPRQVERGTYRSEWTESIGADSTGAFCASDGLTKHSTSAATPDAIEWDGWHSGSVPLKPASEQILWVTKPAEPGPARGNVLKWGTGAVNVDGCRVPGAPDPRSWTAHRTAVDDAGGRLGQKTANVAAMNEGLIAPPGARYPSNLLVTARALGDDSKYGDLDAWAREHGISEEWLEAALSAGVLRVPKPARSEKNAGCDGLEQQGKPRPGSTPRRCGQCGTWEGKAGTTGCSCGARDWTGEEWQTKPQGNLHPTVKPTTLFAFLCTLACPRGGVVLDPFGGSGTTGVAAIDCGMHWVLIEREAEYVTIAEARTEHAAAARRQSQPAFALEAAT